jgi:hypothetical protein
MTHRPYQYRLSDHLAAERSWRFSPIQPMQPEPRKWWRIIRKVK